MAMNTPTGRVSTALAASLAIGLGAIGFAAGGPASAHPADPHDKGGPVIYLNNHNAPRDCELSVTGIHQSTDSSGRDSQEVIYEDTLKRPSCDGTLWLPPGANVLALGWKSPDHDPEHQRLTEVYDDEAICLLAKTNGKIIYTNRSVKGGDCNGD